MYYDFNQLQSVKPLTKCDSNLRETFSLAERLSGSLITDIRQIARDNQIWLSLGGFHQKLDEQVSNTHVLINAEGDIVQTYDKVHLFDAPLVGLGHWF